MTGGSGEPGGVAPRSAAKNISTTSAKRNSQVASSPNAPDAVSSCTSARASSASQRLGAPPTRASTRSRSSEPTCCVAATSPVVS